MAEGRQLLAGHTGYATMANAGLSWALKNLTEDSELEPFVDGIPAFCTEAEDAAVMMDMMMAEDVQLLPRIMSLLQTCVKPGSLKPDKKQVRTITCLNAIAKLCKVHSIDPWAFLLAYEPALRPLIIPMTTESDPQVAEAAQNVVAIVVEHINSCCLKLPGPPRNLQELENFPNTSDAIAADIDNMFQWAGNQKMEHSGRVGCPSSQDLEDTDNRREIEERQERWRCGERQEWQPFGPIFVHAFRGTRG